MTIHPTYRPVIMVVDDNKPVRTLLCDLFVDEGYEVVLAPNGQVALTAMETVTPNLVTLDLEMPGMNGERFLETIRRQAAAQEVIVIVISAQENVPRQVRELAQAQITKPFDLTTIIDLVEQFMLPQPVRTQRLDASHHLA